MDGWVPIETRKLYQEEYEDYIAHGGRMDRERLFTYCNQLPADGEVVLVTTRTGFVGCSVFFISSTLPCFDGYGVADDLIAWRPLPAPYIGEKPTKEALEKLRAAVLYDIGQNVHPLIQPIKDGAVCHNGLFYDEIEKIILEVIR